MSFDAPASGFDLIYRGTSLIRKRLTLGPYSRTMARVLWWPWEGGLFLMSQVPLYRGASYKTKGRDTRERYVPESGAGVAMYR